MDTTYQVESLWNLDTNNEVHGVGRHYTTQLYEREGGDSNLKDDQYSEELGAADRALARIGLGPSRRRPFQNHQDRIQTAQTRKDKACLRCRMQHIRVLDPFRNLIKSG